MSKGTVLRLCLCVALSTASVLWMAMAFRDLLQEYFWFGSIGCLLAAIVASLGAAKMFLSAANIKFNAQSMLGAVLWVSGQATTILLGFALSGAEVDSAFWRIALLPFFVTGIGFPTLLALSNPQQPAEPERVRQT